MKFKDNIQFQKMTYHCLRRRGFPYRTLSITILYFDYAEKREERARAMELHAFGNFPNLISFEWV